MNQEEVIGFLALIGICCGLFLMGYALPDRHTSTDEVLRTIQVKNNSQDEAIESLEREIRILKTDMHVLQNGYEDDYAE